MKVRMLIASVLGAVCWADGETYSQRPEGSPDNVQTLMRAKLEHAQKVLEGVVLEDFELVASSAQKMSVLSGAAQWQVIQTPEYSRRSGEFRRAVESLAAAARKKNLDGATLTYVSMTMKCVECHKYVRKVGIVKLDNGLRDGKLVRKPWPAHLTQQPPNSPAAR